MSVQRHEAAHAQGGLRVSQGERVCLRPCDRFSHDLVERNDGAQRGRAAPREQDDAAGDFAFDIQVVRNNSAKAVKLNVF